MPFEVALPLCLRCFSSLHVAKNRDEVISKSWEGEPADVAGRFQRHCRVSANSSGGKVGRTRLLGFKPMGGVHLAMTRHTGHKQVQTLSLLTVKRNYTILCCFQVALLPVRRCLPLKGWVLELWFCGYAKRGRPGCGYMYGVVYIGCM